MTNAAVVLSTLSLLVAAGALANSFAVGKRTSKSFLATSVAQSVQIDVDRQAHAVVIYNNSTEAILVQFIVCGADVIAPPHANLESHTSMSIAVPAAGDMGARENVSVTFEDSRGWMWQRVGRLQPTRIPRT